MTPSVSGSITAFAPATVGNVICGFDVLGLALERPGDRVTATRSDAVGVTIGAVRGDGGKIPRDTAGNSAGIAAEALLERAGIQEGVTLEIEKGLPLSGGMGGSAASAVAAAVAVDALFGLGSDEDTLFRSALEGEEVVSGGAHADNVGPCLLGGIVLARSEGAGGGVRRSPRSLVPLPVPRGMSAALLHPRVEMRTREARALLPRDVPLADAVGQWGDTAAFVAGLFQEDWELIADSLTDRIAEPARAPGIPAFEILRGVAVEAGAVGFGISGAGPTVIAICRSAEEAKDVGERMSRAYRGETGADGDLFVSKVARGGARIVEQGVE